MGRMGKSKKKVVSLFLVMVLLSGLITGCSSKGSANVNEKLELAVKYLSEQKYEEAILAYQEVIKIDNKNVIAYKGISLAYTLQEKPDQAEQALQQGLTATPQNAQLQLAMAGLMLDQGKNDEAEKIFKEILAIDKTNLSTYQAYTQWLVSQDKKAEAITLVEKALTDNQNQYLLSSLLAGLYLKSKDNTKALASISQSLNQQTEQTESYSLLEKIYNNRWSELIALGDQYIQQNQVKIGQLIKLTALYNMGNYGELINQFENLPIEIKDSAKARLLASLAYIKLGKPDQAGDTIKSLKVAELKDSGILAGIASCYLDAGDKENARKLAVQGINQDNMVLDNYITLYKLYKNDDAAQARLWLYKYILTSASSYQSSIRDLISAGVDTNILGISPMMERIKSMEIVDHVVPSSKQIQEFKKMADSRSHWVLLSCYVDVQSNVAYTGYIFAPLSLNHGVNGWKPSNDILFKPVVFRIHQPKIYLTKEVSDRIINDYKERRVPEFKYYQNYEKVVEFDSQWHRVVGEGGSFEDHMKRAGIKPESIIFIDF